jgi:hypothetical protein
MCLQRLQGKLLFYRFIGCRISYFAGNASSGYDVAPQTQNLAGQIGWI